ncbi:NB-ARC domain-containing protein [Leptothoe sp. ISB3NOV94-8A]
MNRHSTSKKILVLAAHPKKSSELRLGEEVREIEEGLKRSLHRDSFNLISRWAVRPKDFRRHLLDINPQIVHFSGHGVHEDGIVLEDELGDIQLVSSKALKSLFKLFSSRGVECVLLNACYSEKQADAISQHIDYVIGMSKDIDDEAAISFSVAFYDALGNGWSYEEAFELGCNSIQMEDWPDFSIPILKKRRELIEGKANSHDIKNVEAEILKRKDQKLKELEKLIDSSEDVKSLPKEIFLDFLALRDEVEILKQVNQDVDQKSNKAEKDFLKDSYGIPELPVEFIDRPEQRETIEEPLKSRERWVKTVVIQGMGGTGKTVLATEIVRNIKNKFEKVIWASANESPIDLADLLDIVLRKLDYRSDQLTLAQKQEQVNDLLRKKRYLLVIDSFERIGDDRIDKFLGDKTFYPSKILITTRQFYPQASCLITLEGLTRQQTRRMLERARLKKGVKHAFTTDTVKAIYSATGGLPLALGVIIGLLSENVSLNVIINSLTGRGTSPDEALSADVSKVEAMFTTLIGASWKIVSNNAQRILMGMTFFAAPASEQAIQIISDTDQEEFRSEIDHLIRLSLLHTHREQMGGDEFRYSIHPLIRSFASEKINSNTNLKQEIYGKAVDYFTELMEELGRPGLELTKYNKLEQDLKNCIATFDWCKAQRDFANTFKVVESLHHFLFERGFWDTRIQICSSAFNLEDDSTDRNPEISWRLAFRAGWVCSRQNNYEEAKQWRKKAKSSLKKVATDNVFYKLYQAKNLQLSALIAHGEAIEAVEEYKQLTIPEMIGDINNLFEQSNNYHDEARQLLTQYLQEHGLTWSSEEPEYTISITDSNQGDLAVDRGHWNNIINQKDESIKYYEIAQKLYSKVLDDAQNSNWRNRDAFIAFSAANLGHVEIWLGQKPLEEIKRRFDKALQIAQYIGRDHTIAWCYRGYGLIARRLAKNESSIRKKKKKLKEALEQLSDALDIFERIGRRERVTETRKALLEVETALGAL